MKLRQNKNEEIDLRTIADMELGNQINSMSRLPDLIGEPVLDYISKYIGQGMYWGRFRAVNAPDLPSNNWGYLVEFCLEEGEHVSVTAWMATKSTIYMREMEAAAIPFWKTGWVEILTDQTGVKKSGDVMSGYLAIASPATGYMRIEKANENISQIISKNVSDDRYTSLQINTIDNALLCLYDSVTGAVYNIYGEHNPQVVVSFYNGDGADGRVITLPFTPVSLVIVKISDMTLKNSTPTINGVVVGAQYGNNINGELYAAYAINAKVQYN